MMKYLRNWIRCCVLALCLFTIPLHAADDGDLSVAEGERCNDRLIVPGERVGPINWQTTFEDLVACFGRDQVVVDQINTGEGDTELGVVVFPKDPEKRLDIVWRYPEEQRWPSEISIYGTKSEWKTKEGVTLGTTLRELEVLNTMPFHLVGFGHDWSGVVVDRGKGSLTLLGLPEGEHDSARRWPIAIALLPDYSRNGETELGHRRQVAGDAAFSSGHPAMQALAPKVAWICVSIFKTAVEAKE